MGCRNSSIIIRDTKRHKKSFLFSSNNKDTTRFRLGFSHNKDWNAKDSSLTKAFFFSSRFSIQTITEIRRQKWRQVRVMGDESEAQVSDVFYLFAQAKRCNAFSTTPLHHAAHYNPAFAEMTRTQSMTLTVMKFIREFILVTRKQNFLHFLFHHKYSRRPRFSAAAKNKQYLRLMGITHVLNTAEGTRFGQVDTGHGYYRDMPNLR